MKKICGILLLSAMLGMLAWAKPSQNPQHDEHYKNYLREQILTGQRIYQAAGDKRENNLIADVWIYVQTEIGLKFLVFGASVVPQVELHFSK